MKSLFPSFWGCYSGGEKCVEGALPCWKVAWHVGGEYQGLGRRRRAGLPGDGRRASLETGRATAGAAWRLRGSGQTQVLLCGGTLLLFQGPCIVLNCPSGFVGKEPACNVGDTRDSFDHWVGKIPWRRAGQRTPVFLPGESCGQRSLAGCSWT